jgi:hypothetical protein
LVFVLVGPSGCGKSMEIAWQKLLGRSWCSSCWWRYTPGLQAFIGVLA